MTAAVSARDALDPDPAAPPFAPHHAAVRAQVRAFVAERLAPYVDEWEAEREFPRSVFAAAGAAGLLGWKYGAEDGGRGPDLLADVVVSEELARCGSGGVAAGLGACKDLAPYYLARFGTPAQRCTWLRPSVRGETVSGLAVTEPAAGGDVGVLRTRATRDRDGWVLTGEKTPCINGAWADWLLVAAGTAAEPGPRAVSLFIVPATVPGLTATRIPTLGWRTSKTGLLALDHVRVPGTALLGEPGRGLDMILGSFQWERTALAVAAVSAAAANLAACRPWLRSAGPAASARWVELARRLASVRALTYAGVNDQLAGQEPRRLVSAAKWMACNLDFDTADLRYALAFHRVAPGSPPARAADRALRDARLGPVGAGAREAMAELVTRATGLG